MTYRFSPKIPLPFFLIWMVCILVGCRKEEITEIYEVDIEDPMLVENPVAKGTISYGGNILIGVKVEVHQDGKLVGFVLTDQNGNFNTQSISLIPSKDVTLYCKKQGYVSTPYRFKGTASNVNILLLPTSVSNYIPNELIDPSSPNLILLKGKVINGLENGQVARGLTLYNVTKDAFGVWKYEGAVFETNSDGTFQILVPKKQELYYQIKQEGCQAQILTKSSIKLFDESPAELIGPFADNTELPTINNNITNVEHTRDLKITMQPNSCLGFFLIKNGSINWQVKVGSQTKNLTSSLTGQAVNESFLFCLSEAEKNLPTLVSYTVYDFDTKTKTSLSNIQTTNTIIDFGVVRPCDPIEFSFELIIDEVLYQSDIANFVDQINAGIENDKLTVPLLYSNNENRWIRFNIPNLSQPNTLIKDFRYLGNNGYYYQKNQEIKSTITSIANNIITGTLQGMVEDESNGNKIVPVKGKFNFKYQ